MLLWRNTIPFRDSVFSDVYFAQHVFRRRFSETIGRRQQRQRLVHIDADHVMHRIIRPVRPPNPFGHGFPIRIGVGQKAGQAAEAITAPAENVDNIDRNRRIASEVLDGQLP